MIDFLRRCRWDYGLAYVEGFVFGAISYHMLLRVLD